MKILSKNLMVEYVYIYIYIPNLQRMDSLFLQHSVERQFKVALGARYTCFDIISYRVRRLYETPFFPSGTDKMRAFPVPGYQRIWYYQWFHQGKLYILNIYARAGVWFGCFSNRKPSLQSIRQMSKTYYVNCKPTFHVTGWLMEATKKGIFSGPATKALPPSLELSGNIFSKFFFLEIQKTFFS